MRTLIFASLASLALAGCGAVPAEESTAAQTANTSAATDPVDLVNLDESIVARCNNPRNAADLVVRVPGSQSNVGKAYRRAGCVTLAIYEGKSGQVFEFGHYQRGIGLNPHRDVISSYAADETVVHRTDFDPTNLTAAAVAALVNEVG